MSNSNQNQPPGHSLNRRAFLVSALCSACTAKAPIDSAAEECAPSGLSIDLLAHPELLIPGRSVAISQPENLLHIVVACVEEGRWSAVWRICNHGACDLEWKAARQLWDCPCHHSIFDVNGLLLSGPAERDQVAYDVCREGDLLLLARREL